MMKSVLVVALLALMGTPVVADCGWVLWTLRTYQDQGPTWDIETATPGFEQCEVELAKAVDAVLKPGSLALKPQLLSDKKSVLMFSTTNQPVMSIFFKCLPGTLDPRPR